MTRKEEINHASIAYNKKVNFIVEGYIPNVDFINGAEWADKTRIDKVCECARKLYLEYAHNELGMEYFINDLCKAMEE